MGVVEDVRQVVQDFVAPELRELRARIDALEEQQQQFRADVDRRFESVDKRFESVDRRFDTVDKRFDSVDRRLDKLEDKLTSFRDEIMTELRRTANIHDLMLRVTKLKAERHPSQ